MTREEFITNLYNEVIPWLTARQTTEGGPCVNYDCNTGIFYLYRLADSAAIWSIDLNLCVDILNCKNAITPAEMIHGIMLCLEARNDKNQSWSL